MSCFPPLGFPKLQGTWRLGEEAEKQLEPQNTESQSLGLALALHVHTLTCWHTYSDPSLADTQISSPTASSRHTHNRPSPHPQTHTQLPTHTRMHVHTHLDQESSPSSHLPPISDPPSPALPSQGGDRHLRSCQLQPALGLAGPHASCPSCLQGTRGGC